MSPAAKKFEKFVLVPLFVALVYGLPLVMFWWQPVSCLLTMKVGCK